MIASLTCDAMTDVDLTITFTGLCLFLFYRDDCVRVIFPTGVPRSQRRGGTTSTSDEALCAGPHEHRCSVYVNDDTTPRPFENAHMVIPQSIEPSGGPAAPCLPLAITRVAECADREDRFPQRFSDRRPNARGTPISSRVKLVGGTLGVCQPMRWEFGSVVRLGTHQVTWRGKVRLPHDYFSWPMKQIYDEDLDHPQPLQPIPVSSSLALHFCNLPPIEPAEGQALHFDSFADLLETGLRLSSVPKTRDRPLDAPCFVVPNRPPTMAVPGPIDCLTGSGNG
jgi:hypothetical protein